MNYCGRCGHSVIPGAHFCSFCGLSCQTRPQVSLSLPGGGPRSQRSTNVILTTGAVLICGLVGIAVVSSKPSTGMAKQGNETYSLVNPMNAPPQLPPPKPPTKAELRAQAIAAKARESQEAAADEVRRAYAKIFENGMLAKGINVDADAIGPHHTTLRLKYVLASKVDAYQITNEQQAMLQIFKTLGFKKFVVSDGYQHSWTWNLEQ
jgi:hypothetical protein